jgi:hypothetical protein
VIYLRLKERLRRLRGHVDARSDRVELPTVVDASQAALLVPSEEQRRATMGAVCIEETDSARAVAEGDEILAEESHADRRTVLLWNFVAQKRR